MDKLFQELSETHVYSQFFENELPIDAREFFLED
jgi:hypothetical protein